jgi:hypothetical protein
LDDGVKLNRTRQLIVHRGASGGMGGGEDLAGRLQAVLAAGGRQVKADYAWPDRHLAIVHDVELPIPLYYLEPVTGEIEGAYLRLAADERRSWQLHTDYRWEKSLPNLNPRCSEITVGWALSSLAEGLVTGVVTRRQDLWVWNLGGERRQELGADLSSALYRIGEMHRNESLQQILERSLSRGRERLGEEGEAERRRRLGEQLEAMLADLGLRELNGELSREDSLDRPLLRVLLEAVEKGAPPTSSSERGDRYAQLLN